MFSVNPSPKESELVYSASPEALNAWRMDAAVGSKSAALVSRPRIGLRGILQQRLWWWMVLAGIMFLMAEMALAERRTKHS
jgi:hypothetical protein